MGFYTRLPLKTKEKLSECAHAQGRSAASLLVDLIEMYIDNPIEVDRQPAPKDRDENTVDLEDWIKRNG